MSDADVLRKFHMAMILSQVEDRTAMSGMQIYLAAVQNRLCVCLLTLSLNYGNLIIIILFALFSIKFQ
jgi:hypothetical protein